MSEFPSDWEVTNLGVIAKIKASNVDKKSKEGQKEVILCNYMDVFKNPVVSSSLDFMKSTASEKEISEFRLSKGDILLTKDSEVPEEIGIPSVVTEDIPNLICGYHLYMLRSDQSKIDPRYLCWMLRSSSSRQYFYQMANGSTRFGLNLKHVEECPVAIPPLPEQKKIAEILSGIQDVICAKERKRLKLSLLRSSAIAKFTQYGLRKYLLNSSSVGEIPENWRICTLGEVFERYSYGPRFSAEDYSTVGNVRTIRGTDVSASNGIRYSQVPLAKLDNRLVSNHALSDGDVVMITTADCGLTSVFRKQEQPFICSAYAVRFTPSKAISPDYFVLFMQSELALRQVDAFVRRGTVSNLPGSDVLKIKLPLPPVEEQNFIVKIIHSVNSLIRCTDNQIDFYKNIQKSISVDLLSGRKRVGDARILEGVGI